MKKILLLTLLAVTTKLTMAQTSLVMAPANGDYAGLSKNIPFNAGARYTVTQTGTRVSISARCLTGPMIRSISQVLPLTFQRPL